MAGRLGVKRAMDAILHTYIHEVVGAVEDVHELLSLPQPNLSLLTSDWAVRARVLQSYLERYMDLDPAVNVDRALDNLIANTSSRWPCVSEEDWRKAFLTKFEVNACPPEADLAEWLLSRLFADREACNNALYTVLVPGSSRAECVRHLRHSRLFQSRAMTTNVVDCGSAVRPVGTEHAQALRDCFEDQCTCELPLADMLTPGSLMCGVMNGSFSHSSLAVQCDPVPLQTSSSKRRTRKPVTKTRKRQIALSGGKSFASVAVQEVRDVKDDQGRMHTAVRINEKGSVILYRSLNFVRHYTKTLEEMSRRTGWKRLFYDRRLRPGRTLKDSPLFTYTCPEPNHDDQFLEVKVAYEAAVHAERLRRVSHLLDSQKETFFAETKKRASPKKCKYSREDHVEANTEESAALLECFCTEYITWVGNFIPATTTWVRDTSRCSSGATSPSTEPAIPGPRPTLFPYRPWPANDDTAVLDAEEDEGAAMRDHFRQTRETVLTS